MCVKGGGVCHEHNILSRGSVGVCYSLAVRGWVGGWVVFVRSHARALHLSVLVRGVLSKSMVERRDEFSPGAHGVVCGRCVYFRSGSIRFLFVFVACFHSNRECMQYAVTTLFCEEGSGSLCSGSSKIPERSSI